MLALRLRPPLRCLPSRAYSSPSLPRKSLFSRPFLWWLKARYRGDGTRRSTLLGLLHGACYVGVSVYAYRYYRDKHMREIITAGLSEVVELQRIHRKYRNSTFTEPVEIKAYLSEMAEVKIDAGTRWLFSALCQEYDVMLEVLPEGVEKVRKSICKLHEAVLEEVGTCKGAPAQEAAAFLDMTVRVRVAHSNLVLEAAKTITAFVDAQIAKGNFRKFEDL